MKNARMKIYRARRMMDTSIWPAALQAGHYTKMAQSTIAYAPGFALAAAVMEMMELPNVGETVRVYFSLRSRIKWALMPT